MPTATTPLLATRAGVELAKVGSWNASQGDSTITVEDIASMVAGYQNHLVDRAPIKIGHTDERFQDPEGNPPTTGDGSPAYGWVENVRASQDGTTLIADLVGMPAKLADIMTSAFRGRSIEIEKGRRVAGKVYRSLLSGVALLGIQPPAIKGLDDVLAQYSDQLHERGQVVFVDFDTPPVHHSQSVAPSAVGHSSHTIGGPAVKISDTLRQALGIPADADDATIADTLKAAGVAVLPPDPAAPATPAPPPAPPAPVEPPAPAEPAAPAQPLVEKVAASEKLTVPVDRVAFAQLQADAEAGRKAREEQIRAQRDRVVHAAFSAGKIHPTMVAEYRQQIDANEAGITALLEKMPAMFSTSEIGHSLPGQVHTGEDADAKHKRAMRSFT